MMKGCNAYRIIPLYTNDEIKRKLRPVHILPQAAAEAAAEASAEATAQAAVEATAQASAETAAQAAWLFMCRYSQSRSFK